MKMIILLSLLFFTGCAQMGTILQGAGNGLQHASRTNDVYLTPDGAGGYYVDNGQHCSSDYNGGYNCY